MSVLFDSSSSSRDVFLNTWPLSLWLSPHVDIYTYFKGFAMHAIIICLYYLSKLLNLTLNLESLSSRFLNQIILLANFSAAGKLFQLVITLLLNVDFPILEWNCFANVLPSEFLVLSVLAASKKWSHCKSMRMKFFVHFNQVSSHTSTWKSVMRCV